MGVTEAWGRAALAHGDHRQAIEQLAREACGDRDAAQAALECAALREAIFERCEQGALTLQEARALCKLVDEVQLRSLQRDPAPLDGALQTFESLVEASPLPIVASDCEGLVRIWNRAAEELFGWSRAEVLGKPDPLAPEGAAPGELRAAVQAGEVVRGREVRAVRKDGTPLDLTLSMAPLRDRAGEVRGCIAILADISDRKRREAQGEATARFREHFVGIVGHDLRNPLTAILTSAQLVLRYGNLEARQARVISRISSSAERMARMIDDLLDFARSNLGGGFPIHPRRMDLREVTEQAVEELIFANPGREVRVTAQGNLWGSWDRDRMAQVVSNLVGNALQHSDGGEVRVALRGEREVVSLETHNGGAPIPPEVLPHVFEPGRRGSSRSGGLGLGLFIVQQIVLAHGGSIEVRSSEDEGTRFEVRLPRTARA